MATPGVTQPPGRPCIPGDQALKIAAADAEAAYQDLSSYRITLALEQDGWHIDYNLKSRTAVGGGPHYIIDSANGTILWKRYDQ